MATSSRLRHATATVQAIARSATTRSHPPFALAAEGAELVQALKERASASHDTGLRITIDSEHRSLSMCLAERQAHDHAVSTDGAQVFFSDAAAKRLNGCTLRASTAAHGSSFYLDRSMATSGATNGQ